VTLSSVPDLGFADGQANGQVIACAALAETFSGAMT